MNLPDKFPLITLQPVADANNVWISFILSGSVPLDQVALVRVLNGYGLAEIFESVTLEAHVDPESFDAAFVNDYPSGRLILRGESTPLQTPATLDTTSTTPKKSGDPTARGILLKLLSLVTSDADSTEIEAVIKRDPNLSYHLLKLVNSVAFAPGKKITNFGQAIALLGRRQLQRWLQLLLYARPQGSATASPLLPRAALRASLMEALVKRQGLPHEAQDHAFMVGMFSLLEALFGMPLSEVITPLNLTEDVIQALTTRNNPLGSLLAIVIASEAAPGDALTEALNAQGIANDTWAAALAEAVRWAVQVSREA